MRLKYGRHFFIMEEKEIWKQIEGFNNYYISNLGNVKSVNYANNGIEKELVKVPNYKGYLRVVLYNSNKKYKKRVSILVALHFIKNPENKPQVNHKDGNKLNNNYCNLEWATASENIQHAYDTGLRKSKKFPPH